jgi:predicted dehydrogenase
MVQRRDFLKTSGVLGAGTMIPYYAKPKAFANTSANDRPVIGCIGVGSMGTGDAQGHASFGDVVAVCDVDSRHADRAKNHDRIGKGVADAYSDYRKVLERDDIEVVSVVTPDHWHVKIAIEALMAGKHVFCQKPLTLTLEENQLIRNACKKYSDKAFLVGTQQRSDRNKFLRAVNMVQKGLLGDIKKVTVGINGSPTSDAIPVVTPPAELDWEKWQGQAPLEEYRDNGRNRRSHYEFRWWYEYSGGKFTDWGAHHIDIALWALNQNGPGQGPISFDGTDSEHPTPYENGYTTLNDRYNTSHNFAISCMFDDGIEMVVDSRSDNGILFEGSKGRMFVNRGKIAGTPIDENWDEGKYTEDDVVALYKGKQPEGHKNNFYRVIAEGGETLSDVFTHVQAMNSCHLCAIAARLGRKVQWDPKEEIVGDDQAATFFARTPREGYEIPRV